MVSDIYKLVLRYVFADTKNMVHEVERIKNSEYLEWKPKCKPMIIFWKQLLILNFTCYYHGITFYKSAIF